jgi:hypothetical protein
LIGFSRNQLHNPPYTNLFYFARRGFSRVGNVNWRDLPRARCQHPSKVPAIKAKFIH